MYQIKPLNNINLIPNGKSDISGILYKVIADEGEFHTSEDVIRGSGYIDIEKMPKSLEAQVGEGNLIMGFY